MQNFWAVGQQVLILFLLILVGYVLGKKRILNEVSGKALSDIALQLSSPCVIALSFEREFSVTVLKDLGAALLAAAAIHLVAIGIAQLLYRGDSSREKVLRAGTVLSNAGFMGLPLQQAVLGDQGVFYGSTHVTVFTMTLWSYGLLTMDRQTRRLSARKILCNPGLIGLGMGLLILFLPTELPTIIRSPMSHLAALNTPLPMLFIGYSLSQVDLKQVFRSRTYYVACAVRLLLVPVVAVGILYAVGVRGALLSSMAIAACTPVAAAVSMFAGKFGQDTEAASDMVALSTVFSVITMPVFVALVQEIA